MNKEINKFRSNVLLLCPDNDAEAHMILLLAEKAQMSFIKSLQPHGAKLELEPDLDSKIFNSGKKELWIVETPGIEKENEIKSKGIEVKIIDHHTYNDIDRLTNPNTGEKNLSSLEQFISLAKIIDEELISWGFDPRIVKGIGIMDAKYVRGLRENGYSKEEISKVLGFQQEISKIIRPDFEKIMKLAKQDWDNKTNWNGYLIVKSEHSGDMRNAISEWSIIDDMDTVPMIIVTGGGERISIQNITTEIVDKLRKEIINDNSYTFGSGRCWGIDNKSNTSKVTLMQILEVLK